MVETVLPDGGYTLKGQTRTYYGCDLTTFESRKKGNAPFRGDDGGQALHWELGEDG